MANRLKPGVLLFPLMTSFVLSACVWKSDYDKVVAQNQQLQQQVTAQSGGDCHRQGADQPVAGGDQVYRQQRPAVRAW